MAPGGSRNPDYSNRISGISLYPLDTRVATNATNGLRSETAARDRPPESRPDVVPEAAVAISSSTNETNLGIGGREEHRYQVDSAEHRLHDGEPAVTG